MLSYIKNYSITNIGYKLSLLYLLNISDIIFTLLLINSGYYIEANPLMATILNQPVKLFLVKILLPALLLCFIYIRMKKAEKHQLTISNTIINGALCVYVLLNSLHILWFIILVLISL